MNAFLHAFLLSSLFFLRQQINSCSWCKSMAQSYGLWGSNPADLALLKILARSRYSRGMSTVLLLSGLSTLVVFRISCGYWMHFLWQAWDHFKMCPSFHDITGLCSCSHGSPRTMLGALLMALMRHGLCRVCSGNCRLMAVFRFMKLPAELKSIRAETVRLSIQLGFEQLLAVEQ